MEEGNVKVKWQPTEPNYSLFSLDQTWENTQSRRQSLRKFIEIAEIFSQQMLFFLLYAF